MSVNTSALGLARDPRLTLGQDFDLTIFRHESASIKSEYFVTNSHFLSLTFTLILLQWSNSFFHYFITFSSLLCLHKPAFSPKALSLFFLHPPLQKRILLLLPSLVSYV